MMPNRGFSIRKSLTSIQTKNKLDVSPRNDGPHCHPITINLVHTDPHQIIIRLNRCSTSPAMKSHFICSIDRRIVRPFTEIFIEHYSASFLFTLFAGNGCATIHWRLETTRFQIGNSFCVTICGGCCLVTSGGSCCASQFTGGASNPLKQASKT